MIDCSFQAQNYLELESLLSQHGINITRIDSRLKQFGLDMMQFNASVQQQLSNIQKSAGPEGPVGPPGPKVNSNFKLYDVLVQ